MALLLVAIAVGPLRGQEKESPPVSSASPSPEADAKQIRQALEEWVEATNSGQRLRAAEIWAEDLVGWYPGQPDDTYAAEMERARRLEGVKPQARVSLVINEILVSGDLAVVRDTWTFHRGAEKRTLRSFEVWRRQKDGQWKISRWISAPDPQTQ